MGQVMSTLSNKHWDFCLTHQWGAQYGVTKACCPISVNLSSPIKTQWTWICHRSRDFYQRYVKWNDNFLNYWIIYRHSATYFIAAFYWNFDAVLMQSTVFFSRGWTRPKNSYSVTLIFFVSVCVYIEKSQSSINYQACSMQSSQRDLKKKWTSKHWIQPQAEGHGSFSEPRLSPQHTPLKAMRSMLRSSKNGDGDVTLVSGWNLWRLGAWTPWSAKYYRETESGIWNTVSLQKRRRRRRRK